MDSNYLNSFRELQEKIEKLDLSISPEDEKILLAQLMDVNLLTFGFSKIVPNFQRLTINKTLPDNNNSTIKEIKFLKNPPENLVTKYNRANLKKQSILYATFILPTALLENNPDLGDLVTISHWKLINEDTPLIVYPVFDYYKTRDFQLKQEFTKAIKDYPSNLQDVIIIDNCLVASYFSKYVEKGKEINYTFSAHLADWIFNKMYNGKIEAIIYPSVKDITRSANIAIKPNVFNSKYKLVEVHESIVVSKVNGNILLHEQKRTNKFDNEIILWN